VERWTGGTTRWTAGLGGTAASKAKAPLLLFSTGTTRLVQGTSGKRKNLSNSKKINQIKRLNLNKTLYFKYKIRQLLR
jgi:hypothetical protein